jgi:hypothetical protein
MMEWISLLPKGGGMIQVDFGGHPTLPPTQWFYIFLAIFIRFFVSQTFGVVLRP